MYQRADKGEFETDLPENGEPSSSSPNVLYLISTVSADRLWIPKEGGFRSQYADSVPLGGPNGDFHPKSSV